MSANLHSDSVNKNERPVVVQSKEAKDALTTAHQRDLMGSDLSFAATASQPVAVVIGLCAHGLAMVRALHAAGIPQLALEENRQLPGVNTRCASVHWIQDLNGLGLVQSLLELHATLQPAQAPILFPTNDRMVRLLATHWEALEGRYQLSWQECRARLAPLLDKESLEARSDEVGLNYPRSATIRELQDSKGLPESLGLPIILKPTRPLSAFKTKIIRSAEELETFLAENLASLPILAQHFIEGPEEHIHFGALYLKDGEVQARFEGQKLRSYPMGHTTLAVSAPHEEVHRLSMRFFDGLRLSGPVSLELKMDTQGKWWVIEPTVGRTDFWVGLCIANGVNLPAIEFHQVAQQVMPPEKIRTQVEQAAWTNGERDPFAIFWLIRNHPGVALRLRLVGVYFPSKDWRPFRRALSILLKNSARRLVRKLQTHFFNQRVDNKGA